LRFNFRIKIGSVTYFTMLSTTQRLKGITSMIPNDTRKRHYVFWDIEHPVLEEDEKILRQVQTKYGLSNIYIVSDVEGSYRGWCFSKVSFQTYLNILVDSLGILDYSFFYYTVKRRKATLRISQKKGRPPQKVVSVLESYPVPFPSSFIEHVVYDTGLQKRGIAVLLGGE
jgi:hypothetical protein